MIIIIFFLLLLFIFVFLKRTVCDFDFFSFFFLTASLSCGGAKDGAAVTAASPRASPLLHVFSSQFASAASTLLFYPLDTLRVRFMSQDGTVYRQHNGQTYRSVRRALATIRREEGLGALFRGCHIAVLGSVLAWGVYMYIYRSLCSVSEVSSYIGRTSVSLFSSVVSSFITSPVWLIKSRMQLEDVTKTRHYVSFSRSLRHILQTTGFCSLWRGIFLQLALVFPNSLSIPTYELLKDVFLCISLGDAQQDYKLSILEASFCSTLTKTILVLISHPLMMLKVRLQDQRWNAGDVVYTNIRHSIFLILKREGPSGMMRGVVSSLLHSLPRTVTYFVLYEKTLGFFV